MLSRKEMEEAELTALASYGLKSGASRGRVWAEREPEWRTIFQRDRDRIMYSTAFRRLAYKTQVFVNHEGDHYRTRLTHTLEVAQIARSLARSLRLNQDLAEAVALAHDLGHGPFGHAGESMLAELMAAHGGFNHNVQSLRIVEELEDSYADFSGLNLTFEVREGIKQHGTVCTSFLEAAVVDIADEIAYDSHDLDDGLRAELVSEDELQSLEIWRDISSYIQGRYQHIKDYQRKRLAVRLLINQQTSDLMAQTEKNLNEHRVTSLEDIARLGVRLVDFSAKMRRLKEELKSFLKKNLYNHYRVVRMTDKARRFISQIFQVYIDKPGQLSPGVLRRAEKDGIHRAVCDYIAGMTDRFALDEYNRLFEPYERV